VPVFTGEKRQLVMGEREVMKCPKCRGEMKSGSVPGNFRILKEGDLYGDMARVFYCSDCGFVEFYKEPSTKESRRWRVRSTESEQAPISEGSQQEAEKEETERKPVKRLVR